MVVSRTPSMSHLSSLKVSRSESHHDVVSIGWRRWSVVEAVEAEAGGLVGGDWDQDDGAGCFV